MIDSKNQSVDEKEDRLFGVTALDSPQVQKTKADIRALMTEINKLSRTQLTVQEFVQGFMPRLQSAMGASACLVWSVESASQTATNQQKYFELAGTTASLPLLVESDQPTEVHRQILQCVCDENQPLLVPPAGVVVRSARPVNPIQESLILVPVRILDDIRYLVEVVQRPGGGPAAQKGYLRFVSEMSELMSDFLVHNRLRQLSRYQQIDEENRQLLHALVEAETTVDRERLFADRQRSLAQSDHVLLFKQERTCRLLCISNTGDFDARSELVQLAERLATELERSAVLQKSDPAFEDNLTAKRLIRIAASERRRDRDGNTESQAETTPKSSPDPASSRTQLTVDDFCGRLGCRTLWWARIGNSSYRILFSYRGHEPQDAPIQATLVRYWEAAGILLNRERATRQRWKLPTGRLARTTVIAVLICIACMLPMPDRVSVPALLQPAQQQRYYAPMMAAVKEVLVSDGEWVTIGTPLLQLHSNELDSEILQHDSKIAQVREALAEIVAAIGRSGTLSPERLSELELQRSTLEIQAKGEAKLLNLKHDMRDSLLIRAASDGQVHAWGVSEHLVGRVVGPDELLLSTYQPDSPWKFQLDIPERRAGRIEAKLHSDKRHLPVRFTFVSLPDKEVSGELFEVGPVLNREQSMLSREGSGADSEISRGIVRAEVVIDGNTLAIRKIGAVANASIDCGRVPLGWLLVRDSFVRLVNTIQMLW